jgi:hypothetical protein
MCQKLGSAPGRRATNHSNNKGYISSELAVGAFLTSFDTHRNLQLTDTSSARKIPKELGCRSTLPFTFT